MYTYFLGIHSSAPFIRASSERMAINAPIQGTQADLIKLAMVEIDRMLHENKLENKVHLILQVHDELVYEVPETVLLTVGPTIKKIMESVLTLEETQGVPIIAEVKSGSTWGATEPLVF